MFAKPGLVFFTVMVMLGAIRASSVEAATVRLTGVITQPGGPLELGSVFHGLLEYDDQAQPAVPGAIPGQLVDDQGRLRLICGDMVLESVGGLTLTLGGDASVSSLTVTAGGGWDITAGGRVTHADLVIGFIPGVGSPAEPVLPIDTSFDRFWSDGSSVTFHLFGDDAPAVGDIHSVSVMPVPVGAAVTMSLLASAVFAVVLGRRRKGIGRRM